MHYFRYFSSVQIKEIKKVFSVQIWMTHNLNINLCYLWSLRTFTEGLFEMKMWIFKCSEVWFKTSPACLNSTGCKSQPANSSPRLDFSVVTAHQSSNPTCSAVRVGLLQLLLRPHLVLFLSYRRTFDGTFSLHCAWFFLLFFHQVVFFSSDSRT